MILAQLLQGFRVRPDKIDFAFLNVCDAPEGQSAHLRRLFPVNYRQLVLFQERKQLLLLLLKEELDASLGKFGSLTSLAHVGIPHVLVLL